MNIVLVVTIYTYTIAIYTTPSKPFISPVQLNVPKIIMIHSKKGRIIQYNNQKYNVSEDYQLLCFTIHQSVF